MKPASLMAKPKETCGFKSPFKIEMGARCKRYYRFIDAIDAITLV